MSLRSAFAPVVVRWRTANPYALDTALAALVLFAVSLRWLFPDEGDDRLTWQGWLLGAATAYRWSGGGCPARPRGPCRPPLRRRRCTTLPRRT